MKPSKAQDPGPAPGGRLLAVGDIHGCLRHLERLMGKVAPTPEDRIVFLGDYLDRGPDSRGVVEYLIAFGQRFPRSVFLRGNHEEMFLDFIAGQNQLLYYTNGGESTLENYRDGAKLRIPQDHLDFLRDLRDSYETQSHIFVHAGLRPGLSLKEQNPRDLTWIRDEFIHSAYDWGKTVVFGHTPRSEVLFSANKIALDTGAVYGRTLTCCDVENKICWQA